MSLKGSTFTRSPRLVVRIIDLDVFHFMCDAEVYLLRARVFREDVEYRCQLFIFADPRVGLLHLDGVNFVVGEEALLGLLLDEACL